MALCQTFVTGCPDICKKMRHNFHLMNWSLYPSASAAANAGISDVYGIWAAVVLQLRSFELSAEVDAESLTVYKGGPKMLEQFSLKICRSLVSGSY